MGIQISEHFTYRKLLRFVFPSVVMMIFTSIYGVVDGLFVSNFAGSTAFAGINLIMPYIMIFSTFGFMIGTGGSALVGKFLGEGKQELANGVFSLLIFVGIVLSLVFTLVGEIFLRPVAILFGAEGELLTYCVQYGRICMLGVVFFLMQNCFQSFFVTASEPQLGLYVTVGAGLTNIAGDALLVGLFRWGVQGAALATVLSQAVGGLIPLLHFFRPNGSLLRLGRIEWDLRHVWQACSNGISEFMTNISGSIVGMCYNYQLLRMAGENGVAAYGVIMYVCFIFISIFVGYAIGSAPIVSFHFGAQNRDELKNLFRKSLVLNCAACLVMTGAAELLARPLSMIFVSYNRELLEMTVRAFLIYNLSYLFCGFNIYASSFFTALNNGIISAIISFLRVLVCQIAFVFLLPIKWGLDGIWWSVPAAEIFALAVSLCFLLKERKRYGYL